MKAPVDARDGVGQHAIDRPGEQVARAILQAVTDRDPANAAAAMERHIVSTEQSVEALLAALAPRAGRTDAG